MRVETSGIAMRDRSPATYFNVGVISLLLLMGAVVMTVLVNTYPALISQCRTVRFSTEDATGLNAGTPVRSMGMEIGEVRSIELAGNHVTLDACINKRVRVLPETRLRIRAEGFFGGRFVELEPVATAEEYSPGEG